MSCGAVISPRRASHALRVVCFGLSDDLERLWPGGDDEVKKGLGEMHAKLMLMGYYDPRSMVTDVKRVPTSHADSDSESDGVRTPSASSKGPELSG
jgi:hypothetical protein